ncbi:berberine bridge enzyme-like 17 [Lotus japonicus]|uniref:berberine bridge enzyme-like 17 n=1 Tax=Lotus japonicus TaxID=34305 RepID=UPI002583D5A1|nr:berberine bridge enzyme-like 17 [Lotus japonicus]
MVFNFMHSMLYLYNINIFHQQLETMGYSWPLIVTTLTIVLTISHTTSESLDEKFLSCLSHYSKNLNIPVFKAIGTPHNTSFLSILNARVQNNRFKTATTPKPLAIITALQENHVQATIACAKSNNIQIRIRSGGHDYEGLSYVSDVTFVILDMFHFNAVDVNIEDGTTWVQAGATLGKLYYNIAKKSRVHAFPAGVCATVGVGGHFSGGGYGNLMRKYGLSVDNIIDAKHVNVNGKILDRKSMGEDLFWAIRGGGRASFGVILSWKIKLVPVTSEVIVFNVTRTLEEGATDVVYKWQQVATKFPKDLFIRATHEVVDGKVGKKTVRVSFIGQFLGPFERLLPLVDETFPELGLKQSDCILMPWVNSTLFWERNPIGTPLESLLDVPKELSTSYYKSKSDYVKKPIPKEAMQSMWAWMIKGVNIRMEWNPYGGKMEKILPYETPFPHRAGNLFKIQYYTSWTEADATYHYMNFSRSFYEFMNPYVSNSPREAFLNYRDIDIGANHPSNVTSFDTAQVYGRKFFKDNFERLVRVKTKVDPENFFRYEQSIPPKSP